MGLAQWLAMFRELHERSKAGKLAAAEREVYLSAREELARALLAAQRVQTRPGMSVRRSLRVSRALQADLELQAAGAVRAMTLDLSPGGFGALLASPPQVGEALRFVLRLPGGVRVAGAARVAGVAAGAGSARVSFAFEDIAAEDAERIEVLVFDTLLEQMRN